MPLYLYRHPKTGELKEVIQRVGEPHEYSEGGVKWSREFTVPNAAVDTKINAFSARDFAEKTGKKKGSLGDLFDQSKEASLKRQKVLGHDPIAEKHRADWSKRRNGRKYPTLNSDSTIEV